LGWKRRFQIFLFPQSDPAAGPDPVSQNVDRHLDPSVNGGLIESEPEPVPIFRYRFQAAFVI